MSLLDNIRVLTRAVELGSFSAAGRNMRLSAGVVSHRIGTLERTVSELAGEEGEAGSGIPVAEMRPLRTIKGPNPAGG